MAQHAAALREPAASTVRASRRMWQQTVLLWRPALQAALPAPAGTQDNIKRTRTYDLLISYDKFHSVPSTWLVGYDEDRQPLKPEQVRGCSCFNTIGGAGWTCVLHSRASMQKIALNVRCCVQPY
jgi:Autophagocytosis associated protein, active-site domain